MRGAPVVVGLGLLLIAGACDVGEVPPFGASDAGPCIQAATPGDGNHNPGMGCMTTCHQEGAEQGPSWTVAGTLFDGAGSSTPVTGATILIVDADGTEHALVTATNGNFYTEDAIPFPAMVLASKCPDEAPMVSSFSDGNCNSCHVAGGAAGSVAHLP